MEELYMTEQEEIDEMREEINLTTNLFYKTYNEEKDALFYLLDEYFEGKLDKCYYSVLSYKLYECYLKEDFKRQIYCNKNDNNDGVWEDYNKTTDKGYKSKYRLFNEKNGVILTGEVLNSTKGIIRSYIDDIDKVNIEKLYWKTMHYSYGQLNGIDVSKYKKNEETKKDYEKAAKNSENVEKCKNCIGQISSLAKLFFHLVTTIGNVMPWPTGFNPNGGLDIVQNKFPKYLGLYEWIKVVGNKITGDETEDEKEKCKKEEWIRNFINNHYLQDFVLENKGVLEAIKFLDSDELEKLRGELENKIKEKEIKIDEIKIGEIKKQMKKEWNLYFYRASKAIMKRSYRILTRKDPNAETEFTNAFTDFCLEYGIKNEIEELIGHLSKYEDQKIKGDKFLKIEGEKIDDELQELKKLKEILQRKSEELTN